MSNVASLAISQRGPLLIGAGLAVVLVAQLWPVVPIAMAIMLIGCGATLTLLSRPRSGDGLLAWVNLATYALLACLAIAAQSHAAISTGPTGRIPFPLMADHAAAAVLLVVLIRFIVRRA